MIVLVVVILVVIGGARALPLSQFPGPLKAVAGEQDARRDEDDNN